jgi:ADP-heptose:LPS heptosyltransferase
MILICPTLFNKGSDSRLALRDWPIMHWKELCEIIPNSLSYKIVLTIEHAKLFQEYSDKIITPIDLSDLSSTIKNSSLVVTQDSGVMHLCRFFKIKVIALFGPTDPYIFATNFEIIIKASNVLCSPCHDGRSFTINCKDNVCMKNIHPSDVLTKILDALDLNYKKNHSLK